MASVTWRPRLREAAIAAVALAAAALVLWAMGRARLAIAAAVVRMADRQVAAAAVDALDFYVKYTLVVCLERQETKPFVLDALHANIQDVFNEYGVQIMSPNYVVDPERPKVVPKSHWFPPPARPDAPAASKSA
jgi:hypothetical protein